MHCPFGGERHTMTYNDYGDVCEIHRMSLPTDIDLLQQRPWATYCSYEYDAFGNWVSCIVETRVTDSGETTNREQQRRRVQYWDDPV
jgi:hypothetical protein